MNSGRSTGTWVAITAAAACGGAVVLLPFLRCSRSAAFLAARPRDQISQVALDRTRHLRGCRSAELCTQQRHHGGFQPDGIHGVEPIGS